MKKQYILILIAICFANVLHAQQDLNFPDLPTKPDKYTIKFSKKVIEAFQKGDHNSFQSLLPTIKEIDKWLDIMAEGQPQEKIDKVKNEMVKEHPKSVQSALSNYTNNRKKLLEQMDFRDVKVDFKNIQVFPDFKKLRIAIPFSKEGKDYFFLVKKVLYPIENEYMLETYGGVDIILSNELKNYLDIKGFNDKHEDQSTEIVEEEPEEAE